MIKQAISHYEYGISHDIFSEPVTSYAKLAVDALNKQMPKSVINKGYLYGHACYCPICNSLVSGRSINKTNYCYECGQALDWGGKNERVRK